MMITKTIEVRFRDIDSMGHVNNAVYLNYFEQARMKYFSEMIGEKWDWQRDGIVVARQEIDYKLPVLLSDSVQIETWCEHVGNTSLVFKYNVVIERKNQKSLAVLGKTVIVCYNNIEHKVISVPEKWREKIKVHSTE